MRALLILNFIFISMFCHTQDKEKYFIIGDYMIVPEKKEIRVYTETGGVDWDGYEYRKVPNINYNTTTLLVLGDNIFFKENFPFKWNVEKLKIIYKDDYHTVSRDDQNIYFISKLLLPKKIDISDYTPVNNLIYKGKNGKLFFLDIETYQLSPIDIDIDLASVKHIFSAFFYDKNGLYFFGEHYKINEKGYYDNYIKTSEKLVDGENIKPRFSDKYIAFKDKVFAINTGKNIKELNLNANKIIEMEMGWGPYSLITDGQTLYSDIDYGYDEDHRNREGHYGIWFPALYSGVNLQKIYSPFLHFETKDNLVIFNQNYNYTGITKLVVKIDNTPFLLANKKKTKVDKMLFYRPEAKTTEVFEEEYLKVYENTDFIRYKNTLYFQGQPVKAPNLDIENLRQIEDSDFLTDGKAVFYTGFVTGHGSQKINGVEYIIFEDRIIENAYTSQMKALGKEILSDGITLICKNQQVKIKDLKLNVVIVK